MNQDNHWKDIRKTITLYAVWTVTSVIDSIFLFIWGMVQYYTNRAIDLLQLSGIDRIVLFAFQILFAFSTVAPVVIKIYCDIYTMVIKADMMIRQEIRIEKAKAKKHD